jgi:hypothetical protein
VCLLGLPGLRIFETTNLDICDLGEEHGHRVVRVVGPILLNQRGGRMDRDADPRTTMRYDRACTNLDRHRR